MAYRITREHEICAGHRVYGHESKCAHLHGHGYRVAFTCESDRLDAIGRVIDFSVIKSTLCQWLEDNWDHRMILWEQDPLLATLREVDHWVVSLPLNPTAENMAAHLVEVVGPMALLNTGVRLVSVTIHETSKCSATYGEAQ